MIRRVIGRSGAAGGHTAQSSLAVLTADNELDEKIIALQEEESLQADGILWADVRLLT
jgi:hypothetical protein